MKKQEVIEILGSMPDDIDVDRLIYTLYLKRKLEKAAADISAGRIVKHEEVEREMREWHD